MGKPQLLIVDDENGIRAALDRWFTLRGFQVDQAADGEEALDRCRRKQYDIITMDLEMPRMGGLDAILAIRKFQPRVPIVVLTGYVHDGDTALERGAAKVLTKPLRLRELEEELRGLLVRD